MTTVVLVLSLMLSAAALRRAALLEQQDRDGAWLWIAVSAGLVFPIATARPPVAALCLVVAATSIVFHSRSRGIPAAPSAVEMTPPIPNQRSRAVRRRGRKQRRRRR